MFDGILSFLPLASLYQMRSINRATCRTIEYMVEGEAVLQKEQAAEEERRARARSRSRKRQQKKRDRIHRRQDGRYQSFSDSSYS